MDGCTRELIDDHYQLICKSLSTHLRHQEVNHKKWNQSGERLLKGERMKMSCQCYAKINDCKFAYFRFKQTTSKVNLVLFEVQCQNYRLMIRLRWAARCQYLHWSRHIHKRIYDRPLLLRSRKTYEHSVFEVRLMKMSKNLVNIRKLISIFDCLKQNQVT